MSSQEFIEAFLVGEAQAMEAIKDGMTIVCGGEIGIGNTTVASCITSLLTGTPVAQVIGNGDGSTTDTLARKTLVVEKGDQRARRLANRCLVTAIASVCGLEVAALAGFYKGAAQAGVPIVLDGFVTTAATLIADELWPGTKYAMIAAHLSAEPGHQAALNKLGLSPFLNDWNMRLGEGTGALLLMPLLDSASAIANGMAKLNDLEGQKGAN